MEIIKNLFRKNKKQETGAPFVPYENILRGLDKEPERKPIKSYNNDRYIIFWFLHILLVVLAWLIPILFVVYILTR